MEWSEEPVTRLKNHAGLLFREEPEVVERSLSWQLYLLDEGRTQSFPMELFEDVVDCLDLLNTRFNGPEPEDRSGPRPRPVPDEVSYYVARLLTQCLRYHRKWSGDERFSAEFLAEFLRGVHLISHCWESLLASDVSDLRAEFHLN